MTNPTAGDLTIRVLPGSFAVCRLDPAAPVPAWAEPARGATAAFFTITRTAQELSIVCPGDLVPDGVRAERDFAALRVEGTLDFSLVGILARITSTLADAGISVFVVSTFDTDYILVRAAELAAAGESLSRAGMRLLPPDSSRSI